MGRPSWRWGVVAALIAVLVSLPSLARLLPAGADSDLTADQLLQRVRGADRVPWSGYAEVVGDLDLPDVRELSDLPATIGETTRLRAWWLGPAQYRVDRLTLTGEVDLVVTGDTRLSWDSGARTVDLEDEGIVRLPVGADLLPPALGARLARADGVVPQLIDDRRVAGRRAAGLRLTAADPASTTVDRVDLWADPATGLPLRVEVQAVGAERPSVTTTLLDLDLSAPEEERTGFAVPPDAEIRQGASLDLAALADSQAQFVLPDTLAGLPRADRVEGLGGGVATYGQGFTALTLVPLDPGTAGDVLRRLVNSQPGAQRERGVAVVGTRLVQVLLARGRDRGYLIAGPVPEAVLVRALEDLRRDPPPRR